MDDLEKYVLALRNTHYNKKGQATIASDDEWVDESEWDDLYIDYLFEKRKVIGAKLESYLRLHGFSKISFCKKVGIPLPLLEQILNGQADDKHTFDESLHKILDSLHIELSILMKTPVYPLNKDIPFLRSNIEKYPMSNDVYDRLHDILDFCEMMITKRDTYYKPNMAALHGKEGKQIIDYIRNQTVQTDEDIKARADACMERIKEAKNKKRGENHDSGK